MGGSPQAPFSFSHPVSLGTQPGWRRKRPWILLPPPLECALIGMPQLGHPGRAEWEGYLQQLRSRCCMKGGVPNLGQLSKSAPPSPAPRRLRSSWVRTCSRYVPGLAAGGRAGRHLLTASRRPGRDTSRGLGLSHTPSLGLCGPQGGRTQPLYPQVWRAG